MTHKPRILLIGKGRFGRHYLRLLKERERQGSITLTGVVVRTALSKKAIEETEGVLAYTKLNARLLSSVDAAIVATPPKTHGAIVRKILSRVHVLCEKPVTLKSREIAALGVLARRSGTILMAAHIYRFHPTLDVLRAEIRKAGGKPFFFEATFTNEAARGTMPDLRFDMLHPFDIADALFGPPASARIEKDGMCELHSLLYKNGMKACIRIGSEGEKNVRTVTVHGGDRVIRCDLAASIVEVRRGARVRRIAVNAHEPLSLELDRFLDVVKGARKPYPDATCAARVIRSIEKAREVRPRPKIVIIGGGIFGTTIALECAECADVTLFEKNGGLLQEASFVNQYRHHFGYHYPRSEETVRESQEAQDDFLRAYGAAIVLDISSYYCISTNGSRVTEEEYKEFCRKNSLPFSCAFPPGGAVDRSRVGVCLKTSEPVYDYARLKLLIEERLRVCPEIQKRLGTAVTGIQLLSDGRKLVKWKKGHEIGSSPADFVINATYARENDFASWLGFPQKNLRMDLVELLLVRLPISRTALTVMDGPFATLVPTAENHIFTLGHVKESLHKKIVPKDGRVPRWRTPSSRWKRIMRESMKWFPILKDAEYIESRFVVRAVNAWREYDDARPSDISRHGFGCWSVLGGKIVTCVSTAKEISRQIRSAMRK